MRDIHPSSRTAKNKLRDDADRVPRSTVGLYFEQTVATPTAALRARAPPNERDGLRRLLVRAVTCSSCSRGLEHYGDPQAGGWSTSTGQQPRPSTDDSATRGEHSKLAVSSGGPRSSPSTAFARADIRIHPSSRNPLPDAKKVVAWSRTTARRRRVSMQPMPVINRTTAGAGRRCLCVDGPRTRRPDQDPRSR